MSYFNRDPQPSPVFAIAIITLITLWIILTMVAYGENEMTEEKLVLKQLRMEEGFRDKPYRDIYNHWTIGFGFNMDGRTLTRIEHEHLFGDSKPWPLTTAQMVDHYRQYPMSKKDAEYLLERCLHISEGDCQIIFGKQWDKIPSEKRIPLIDMAFSLALNKLLKFKKMIAAVKESNWKEAGKQVRNSLAAAQLPSRYNRIAKELSK